MKRTALSLMLAAAGPLAHAHPGHGPAQAGHWHASDVLGFVAVVVVLAALALWHDGRK